MYCLDLYVGKHQTQISCMTTDHQFLPNLWTTDANNSKHNPGLICAAESSGRTWLVHSCISQPSSAAGHSLFHAERLSTVCSLTTCSTTILYTFHIHWTHHTLRTKTHNWPGINPSIHHFNQATLINKCHFQDTGLKSGTWAEYRLNRCPQRFAS